MRIEVRELAARPGHATSRRLVALRPGGRVELRWIGLELRVGRASASASAAAHDGSSAGISPAATPLTGRPWARYRMWRTLTESIGSSVGRLGDVDLADLALRAGLEGVGDDLVVELLVDHVAGDDVPVLGEIDLVVLELRGVVRVDGRWRDLRHPTDPVDAVVALDDRGRASRWRREERRRRRPRRSGRRPSGSSRGRRPAGRSRCRSRPSWRPRPRPCRSGGP